MNCGGVQNMMLICILEAKLYLLLLCDRMILLPEPIGPLIPCTNSYPPNASLKYVAFVYCGENSKPPPPPLPDLLSCRYRLPLAINLLTCTCLFLDKKRVDWEVLTMRAIVSI